MSPLYPKLRSEGCEISQSQQVIILPSTGEIILSTIISVYPFLKEFWKSCCCSITQLYPTLCNPMDCNTPGFRVLHHLLEFAQTHVHWVGDAIQPIHPLSFPSPPTFNLSQHQGLFPWVSSSFTSGGQSIGALASASVPTMNIQDWFPLGLTSLIALQFKGLSRVFSNTIVQNHQFFSAQLSSQSYSCVRTWPLEKP